MSVEMRRAVKRTLVALVAAYMLPTFLVVWLTEDQEALQIVVGAIGGAVVGWCGGDILWCWLRARAARRGLR